MVSVSTMKQLVQLIESPKLIRGKRLRSSFPIIHAVLRRAGVS